MLVLNIAVDRQELLHSNSYSHHNIHGNVCSVFRKDDRVAAEGTETEMKQPRQSGEERRRKKEERCGVQPMNQVHSKKTDQSTGDTANVSASLRS
jgi:hypothetical protein